MSIEELIGAKADFLTGCYTKESLAPLFVKLGGEYKQDKKPFSILLIDLDHFKSFNDKYGHIYGDEALKYFASSLRLSLGDLGVVPFRYGGDEFVIVFPGRNSAEAYPFSVQLERHVKKRPFLLKGRLFKMSFSGGIASYPTDGKTIEDLINNADKAMYFSKRHGHGRITRYSKIWQAKLRQFITFIFILALTLSSIFQYYNNYYSSNLIKKIKAKVFNRINREKSWIQQKTKLALEPALSPEPKIMPNFDVVYLKSGGMLEGVIFHEDEKAIEIKLKMESGEGSMVIQKSEIRKIDKRSK